MQDTVMTIIAIIVAGILLFIFPLLAVSERNNDIAQTIAKKAVADFVSEVSTTGSVTLEQYNKLLSSLNTTGNTYNVAMEVKKVDANIGNKSQWVNGNVVGENVQYSVYTEQISKSLEETGSYNLKKGDTFSTTVKNNNKTLAQSFRSMVFAQDNEVNEITAQESAVVTATGAR